MGWIILLLVILCILIYLFELLSAYWPCLLLLAVPFVGWKIYESWYYKSSSFLSVKCRIESYIQDCNDLNQHIESLKDTYLVSNRTDYGDAAYHDSSKWNYKRAHLQNQKYAPNVYNCSRTVCDNARKRPFEYVCKYFGVKPTE